MLLNCVFASSYEVTKTSYNCILQKLSDSLTTNNRRMISSVAKEIAEILTENAVCTLLNRKSVELNISEEKLVFRKRPLARFVLFHGASQGVIEFQ